MLADFCKYTKRQSWIVVHTYGGITNCFVVNQSMSWEVSPGVCNTSWSIDMIFPGSVTSLICFQFMHILSLYLFLVNFVKRHAGHAGTGKLAWFLGRMFYFSIFCSLWNEMWPNCWWYWRRRAAFVFECLSSFSSMMTGFVEPSAVCPSRLKDVVIAAGDCISQCVLAI